MQLKHEFIIIIFVLFFITIAFFIQTDKILQESQNDRLKSEMIVFVQTLMPYYLSGNLDAVYRIGNSFGYTRVTDVPKNATTLYEDFSNILYFRIFSYDSFMGFSVFFLDDEISFVRLVNKNAWDDYKIIILLFHLIIIALLAFFLFHKVLRPLNKLKNAIDELKGGIYAKMITINQKDEIGQLMLAFNEMNKKISHLLKARELITRNIAHELKTPLAKIKLSLSLKDGDELKKDLNRYIDSLNRISQNMLEYERIQEGNFSLNFSEFMSESVLFEALRDFENEKIVVNIIKSVKIKGDLRLLSIAVKNLIENAIKYSDDGVANIELSEKGIMFCNKGKKLQNDILYYFEPFYRGEITKSGYGLGLSIVNEIIKLHKMSIEYSYSGDMHIFYIRF
ncbi:MAG: HAMP domain-containing histidine kinase [Helicobacteraceae bacterium]|nr:HAMP domain-containing histidine kinase [Helicobacteraceae bacterium]